MKISRSRLSPTLDRTEYRAMIFFTTNSMD
jgi:hypothetical protein